MKGLKREGLPITLDAMRNLSDIYIDSFKQDVEKLHILPPTTWSRASDYVREQIRLIKTLDQKAYTYETSDGVYFDISRFPKYGRLGNIDLTKLQSGARVEINQEKRHPADFAVWKKGLLGWNSPWGKGFPGWHIECSAMAIATLGKQIDIHTGGIDHIHTHHNAEIAQSEAATGKQFVRYWMHNAFITIDNTKIAKSLGNSITLRHLLDRGYSADDYRYWLLTAHYRTNTNFTFAALTNAKKSLFRLKQHLYEEYGQAKGDPDPTTMEAFMTAINKDLDTPQAIAILWKMIRTPSMPKGVKRATLIAMDKALGIGLSDPPRTGLRRLGVVTKDEIPEAVQTLLAARKAARENKDWDEADNLRADINMHGYIVKDTPKGQQITKQE